MKKITLAITAILFCFLALFGCNNKQATDVSSSVAKSNAAKSSASENITMTFAKLPSPPKCKKTDNQETIHKVIEYIDHYKKVPIENKNEKGLANANYDNAPKRRYKTIFCD